MAEDRSKNSKSGEKTLIRDISFCGVPENGSNASMVDVKDGKIIRIRPMHYDWKYDPEKDMNPWKFEVRGSTFEPSMKTLIPPYSIAYKKRVYSPARIRFPMKRVDFDASGAPGSTGPANSRMVASPAAETPRRRTRFASVRTAIRKSSQNDAFSTYHTSCLKRASHDSRLRPLTCAQPLRPGRTSCRRACSRVYNGR